MDTELRVCESNYFRAKGIMGIKKRHISDNETCLLGDCQYFIKPVYFPSATIYIEKTTHVLCVKILQIKYHVFKELPKLLLRYRTHYPEKYTPDKDTQLLNFTSRSKICFCRAHLTKQRKNCDMRPAILGWNKSTQSLHK